MTKTSHTTEYPVENIEYASTSPWGGATEIVSNFQNEPLFIESLQNNHIDPLDRSTEGYANALSYYAQDYCTTRAEMLSSDESAQILLLANAPYFIHVQKEMTSFEELRKHRRLDDGEWHHFTKELKPLAVWYNQQLSDYMYVHPESKMSHINQALIEETLEHFPRKETTVEKQLTDTTRGARKEAVTRQLLDLTPVEYTPVTPEDDLRGGDIIIVYKGTRIKVDIKSSLDPIAKQRGGYDQLDKQGVTFALTHYKRDKHGAIIIFPGFTEGELGDNCHLDLAIVHQRAMGLAVQLQRACVELGL